MTSRPASRRTGWARRRPRDRPREQSQAERFGRTALLGIVVAVIGLAGTYFGARVTTGRQAATERDDFLRAQRETAYTTLYNDFVNEATDTRVLVKVIQAGKAAKEVSDQQAVVRADAVVTQRDYGRVLIIGTDPAGLIADHIRINLFAGSHFLANDSRVFVYEAVDNVVPHVTNFQQALQYFPASQDLFNTQMDTFINDAHQDTAGDK